MSGSLTDVSDLPARLAWLGAWRRGALAGAAAVLGALAAGLLAPVAAGVALVAALALAGAVGRAAGRLLSSSPVVDASVLSASARRRAARARARRRRRLAAWLRDIAALRSRGRYDVVPVERVRRARPELRALADEIEATADGDPRIWADVEALLRDAIDSPLLNEALSEDELAMALRSLRYRVATDPRAPGRADGDGSVNDTARSPDRRAPRRRGRHERRGDAAAPPGAAGGRRRATAR